jgi:hypothetical protein
LKRTNGRPPAQRILQTQSEESDGGLAGTAAPPFGHDFSQVAIRPTGAGALQTKLAINKPGDEYEQEADYVAEQVMRMPEPRPELVETPVLEPQTIPATVPEATIRPELAIGNQVGSPSSIQRQPEPLADQGDCSGWEQDCESFCRRAARQYWLDVDGVQPPPTVGPAECVTPFVGPDGKTMAGLCILTYKGGLKVTVARDFRGAPRILEIWRTKSGSYAGQICRYKYHCTAKDNTLVLKKISCAAPPSQGSQQGQEGSETPLPIQRQPADRSSVSQVPPVVAEVLNSRGQPLDSATSAFMESRLGHDFSRVRVHTDSNAARSAGAIDARAYTVGRHIVFGAGQYLPGTQMGRRLLAHELTHVVQQRRSPVARGLSVAGDLHERQAGAVSGALTRGGAIAGLLDPGSGPASLLQRDTPAGGSPGSTRPSTAPSLPPRPLDYDRAVRRLELLQPGATKDQITKALNDAVKAGEITRFEVRGVPAGSIAEIFLLDLIRRMGKKARWGTEADIVTAIGWPARPGGLPPQGQVTVRIDPQGAATAELIAQGPVPAVAQTTVADGTAKLASEFGFAAVRGWGDTPKDAAEISDVLGALELLKRRAPQDIPALKGVELIRVPSLGGNTAGEFSVGGVVSQGSTAPSKPYLKLANSAFGANTSQFFGGGPASPSVPSSFQVILHEVGHAVEAEEFRLAQEGLVKASAELEAAGQRLQEESATFDAERKEAVRKGKLNDFYKKRAESHKRNEEAQAKASARVREEAGMVESTIVTASAIQPLINEATTMKTSAANSLSAAKTAVQALRPDEVQSSAAYVKAIEDASAAITSFALDVQAGKGTIEDLELVVLKSLFDRDRARFELWKPQPPRGHTHRAIFPLDRAVQVQDAWFEAERVLARARQRTRRLQKFIDLVTANKIRRFTQYSVENWQLKPGEFYAEAYSLWLVDPEFVKTNYRVVYDFFQSGDYRR